MVKVLVVEDEASIREMIALNLRLAGMEAVEADSAEAALPLLEQKPGCDAAILDVMLPGMNGFSLCETIRRTDQKIGIIILSAKGQEQDKIRGLSIGADDYITKPFNPVELCARVRSHLRRYMFLGGVSQETTTLRVGGIVLDDESKSVTLDGEPVNLTPLEYSILKLLMESPGKVFSSDEIYQAVWNDTPYGANATVAVHIRHLREKLEIDPANPRYLKVLWGHGYKMEADH